MRGERGGTVIDHVPIMLRRVDIVLGLSRAGEVVVTEEVVILFGGAYAQFCITTVYQIMFLVA